ncbi:hypothetical protein D8I30_03095 [Brevundimonas naejangsanensis]|uniref:Methyltransferase FkbM domain-containing protein n=1 Tax=Brevundimonas naejangsanensis TaxID=588932 RepID=A0A494RK83_9CAUL|nr:hypothetical protein D8I30_03095 [Brevundimonas naejangsanensis]
MASRFDERLNGAVQCLYEAYAAGGRASAETAWNLRFLEAVHSASMRFHAQLLQDAFVLMATGGRRKGQFVEIGVGDGVHLSNTLTLERDFGWRGLLVEANPHFWPAIEEARPLAQLAKAAALPQAAGLLSFRHVPSFPEISSLAEFASGDHHDRSVFEEHQVESVAIGDLLQDSGVRKDVDYVSIDVEGPDVEILEAILDAGYRPKVLTIEHNRVADRIEKIKGLLDDDYEVVLSSASNWDLWAVEKGLAAEGRRFQG